MSGIGQRGDEYMGKEKGKGKEEREGWGLGERE